MVAFITPNRMRDEDEVSNDETRLSDIDQVRNNFVYALEKFALDHDPDTGRHSAQAISRFGVDVSASTVANVTVGVSVGDFTNTSIDTSLSNLAEDTIGDQNVLYVIFGGKGTGAGAGRVEWYMLVSRGGTSGTSITGRRHSASLTTTTQGRWGEIAPGTVAGDADFSLSPIAADMVVASRFPVCANHYDVAYEASGKLLDVLGVNHDSSWLSTFDILSLYDAEEYQVGQVSHVPTYHGHYVRAHGGAYYAIITGGRAIAVASGSSTTWILPGWDDANCYVVTWHTSGSNKMWVGAITFSLDGDPSIGTPSSEVVDTFAKAQGYPAEPAEFTELAAAALAIQERIYVQHRVDGRHKNIPISALTGAAEVASALAVTAPSAVGDTNETYLEADPGDVLYFPSLVGATGSGIVSATISRDGVDVYLVLRRITTGSTNDFTATIWRVSRV